MAKSTLKKKKSTAAPPSIGKRIKVQAQRKFAIGAAIIPVQLPKETASPIIPVPFKQQTREVKLNLHPTHKTSTEDFLTFLCFKGTSEIPSNSYPVSQIQHEQINLGKNLPTGQPTTTPFNSPQPSTSVQGFIPFGVRKQASQFPARNNQLTIQALRTKYNREKQAKLCALAFKKSGDVGSQPKRVQTRSAKDVKLCKPVSKRKTKCIQSNLKTSRPPVGKLIDKPTIPPKRLQSNLTKNVSLRSRIVSVHSIRSSPKRHPLQTRKQINNIKHNPLLESKVVLVDKIARQTKHVKQLVQTVTKNVQQSSLLKINVNKANTRQSPRNIIITRKAAFSKANLKATLLNSPNFCKTRAGTVRKFVPPVVKNKILEVAEQKESPQVTITAVKKKKTDAIDFSSDDDEPLYKKLATDAKLQKEDLPDVEKVSKLKETKSNIKVVAKIHGTRRNIKSESIIQSSLNNPPIVKINPFDKNFKVESNARTTRQNLKSPTQSPLNKSTTDASASPLKFASKAAPVLILHTSTKVLNDKKNKIDIDETNDVNIENKEVVIGKSTKVESSEKRRKTVSSSNLVGQSEPDQLEKSFSDSDEEPLAAKIIETNPKSSNTVKPLKKPKKVPKNEKSKSGTTKKPNLSILIDTETREIADKHVKKPAPQNCDKSDPHVCPNRKKRFGMSNNKERPYKIICLDEKMPEISKNAAKPEVEKLSSQDTTHKFNSLSPNINEISKANAKFSKSEKKKLSTIENNAISEAKRKKLVGSPSSQIPSDTSKLECKDNRNRKFIKSKEYIERWLDSSLRLAADSPNTELMSIHGSKNITPVNLPSTDAILSNSVSSADIGSQNHFLPEQNLTNKLLSDKKKIVETKRMQMHLTKESVLPDTTKELMDASNITAFSKLGLSDPPSNIYEFDSESEMIPFPRKSTSTKPADDHAWKPKSSKELSKGKACTPLYSVSKRRMHNSFAVEESDSSTSKVIAPIDSCAKLTPVQSIVQSEPTEFPISSTAEDSSLDVNTLVTSEDMPVINQQVQSIIVSEPSPICETISSNEKGDDSEGHLFYIPLQGVSKTGVNMEHLIQGVAVKMGTQGPDGSHQRVIMRAKLVTKSQVGSTKNVSENLANQVGPVQDMVRSVLGTIHTSTPFQSNFKPTPEKKSADVQMTVSNVNAIIPSTSPAMPKLNPNNKVTVEYLPVLRGSSKSSSSSSPRSTNAQKRGPLWNTEVINHTNNTAFPQIDDQARMVDAPVFRPTEKEFQDPLDFIEKISPVAARYGLCRIVPPAGFKSECKISDDMRFTPHNQYLHRMLYRWGPSSREMCAIKKYLATQSVSFKQPPSLSNIEVDLPKLYHIVQNMGGLKKVLEKKMWLKVAEEMCIPFNVNYMDIRLDEIYCKYLLPYDTLSIEERRKLFESVDFEWEKRQSRMVYRAANPLSYLCEPDVDDQEYDITEDIEECITRGKSTTLCSFARTAKNIMTMHYGKNNVQPSPDEVETKFWQYVTARKSHVCVSTGSIDSSVWGYGFPNAKSKNTPISKHPWNLKVLTNNSGSVLRSLGPIMGVTVPTLHVGMTFSTCCWYRDPHGLPWIEYLHEGAPKIWYGVPDSQSAKFKDALTSIVPGYCQRKTIWLLSDSTMVPPTMLTEHGVSLCRTVQQPGEYILVFPKAFTSSICTGYNVSESVYFANTNWLDTASQDFTDIRNSCEPSMFSLERLVVAISEDVRSPYQVLKKILPTLNKIIQTEKHHRERLFNFGLKLSERSQILTGKKKIAKSQDEAEECHRCRTNLYLSMFYGSEEGSVYCLLHGAEFLAANPGEIENCKLVYLHSIHELNKLLSNLIERINHLANKKSTKQK